MYSASSIKKWTKLLKDKKSDTLYKGPGTRPTIPSERKNFVPYWLAIEDFCGDGHEEGAFYSRVHIILWAQLMFPRDKEDYILETSFSNNLFKVLPFFLSSLTFSRSSLGSFMRRLK